MKYLKYTIILGIAGGFLNSEKSRAQVLFSDGFDTAASSTLYNFAASSAAANYRATFGYDFGTAYSGNYGIPSAPNSIIANQTALRVEVNILGAGLMSYAFSPTVSFSGNYRVKFDLWMNTIGPLPGGGTGSTEFFTVGVGYAGSTFQNTTSGSGVWFAADSEGGFSGTSTTPDFQARVGTTLQATNSGVYAAGIAGGASSSADNSNPYYAGFTGHAPPDSQTNIVAAQTGTTSSGTLAFAWKQVEVDRIGDVTTFLIDGLRIASVTNSAATASDLISFGYWDQAASLGNTNVTFALIDNIRVEAVPEPSTIALGIAGALGLLVLRRRK